MVGPLPGDTIPQYGGTTSGAYFPISSDDYPSMDVQLKTGEIRNKIDNEQKEAERYVERIEV